MREQIGIDVTARDLASKELGRVQGAVTNLAKSTGSAVAPVNALGGAQMGMAQKAFFALQNLQSVAWAIQTATSMITPMVDAARDWQESLTKTNTVLGEHSAVLLDAAEIGAETMGLSANQVLKYGSEYANLFRAMKLTEEESANMSLATIQLASDISSFNNIDMEEALAKLRSGLVGEYLPMRTVGVQLNELIVAEKALEMGLADTKSEISAQDKVMARFKVMTEQLNLTVGDFARTQGGLANQQRIAAAAMADLQRDAGEALVPVFLTLTQLGVSFMEVLVPTVKILGTQMPAVLMGVVVALAVYAAMHVPATMAAWGLFTAQMAVLGGLLPFIAIGVAVAGVLILLEDNFGVVTTAINFVTGAIGALVGWVQEMTVRFLLLVAESPLPDFLAVLATAIGFAAGVMGNIITFIVDLNEKFNILGTIVDVVGKIFGFIFESIIGFIQPVIDAVGWFLDFLGVELPQETEGMSEAIKDTVKSAAKGVREIGMRGEEEVRATVEGARAIIDKAFPEMEAAAKDYFANLPEGAEAARVKTLMATSSIMAGVAKSLRDGRESVKSAKDFLKEAIKDAVDPEKEAKRIAKFLDGKYLARQLESSNQEIVAAAEAAKDAAEERLYALENGVLNTAVEGEMEYGAAYKLVAEGAMNDMYVAQADAAAALQKQTETNFFRYGERTMQSYADGLELGGAAARTTLDGVLRDMVPLVEAKSPPTQYSPLHKIDTWGERTINAFGDGMRRAGVALRQSAAVAVSASRPAFDAAPSMGGAGYGSESGSVVINNNFQPQSIRKDEDIRRLSDRLSTQVRLRGGLRSGSSTTNLLI
jgi:hypothetical protein